MLRIVLLIVGTSCLVVGVVGCGSDSTDVVPTHKITGTVTLNGRPLPKGEIIFETEGFTGGAAEIKDGKYLTDAKTGNLKVRITARKETGPKDATGLAPSVELIPARYNEKTTLQREVKEGENKFDFALKSK